MRTDNYPDDIRQYDNDPRSPFYENPADGLEELDEAELLERQSQLEDALYASNWSRIKVARAERYLRAIEQQLIEVQQ